MTPRRWVPRLAERVIYRPTGTVERITCTAGDLYRLDGGGLAAREDLEPLALESAAMPYRPPVYSAGDSATGKTSAVDMMESAAMPRGEAIG